MKNLALSLVTEFIGTFIFLSVILGTGEALPIAIALAAAIFFGGKYSGGNFNPAVSFMMFLNNKLDLQTMIAYILVQLIAGATAYYFVTSANKNKLF
jgi:glycerol uptake facilitator-like aquaporin